MYQASYSKPLLANLGVKQVDSLSPTLFKIFVDDLGDYFNHNLSHPVSLQDEKFNHLLYADDLLLLSESADGLQHCLDCLQKYSIDWKITVNFKKTQIIIFSKMKLDKKNVYFYYGPNKIDIVDCYK